jgi:thiol-disulfide isomerase/thioredoxin
MKRLAWIGVVVLLSITAQAQKVEVVKFDRIEQLLTDLPEGKIRIINFWATWCGPCVKEIPYFEKVAADRPDVELVLVSLDFVNQKDKVDRFVERRSVKSIVVLLDETDYNAWIDRVEPSWQGAIPFTLLLKESTNRRKIIDRELEEGELEQYIEAFLKQN